MPAATEIQTLALPGFAGGLNTEQAEFTLDPNYVVDVLNLDFEPGGAVRSRRGIDKYRFGDPDLPLNQSIHSVAASGDVVFWLDQNGDIWKNHVRGTPGVFGLATITAAAEPDGYTYCTNKNATTVPVKATSTSTTTNLTVSIFDGTSSTFPLASFLVYQHERMFAANVLNAGTRGRARIYFSNLDDPETWDATDYLELPVGTAADGIYGMVSYGDALLVFTRQSLWMLTGSDPDTFALYEVLAGVGTRASKTIAVNGASVYYVDDQKIVRHFDGVQAQEIGQAIRNRIVDTSAVLAAGFFRDRYFLSLAGTLTYVFDSNTGAWTHYDYGGVSWAVFYDPDGTPALLFGDTTAAWQAETDLTVDLVTDIPVGLRTAWIGGDGAAMSGRLRKVDMVVGELGSSADVVTVSLYGNGDKTTALATDSFDLTPRPSQVSGRILRSLGNWPVTGYGFQLELSGDFTTPFALDRVVLHLSGHQQQLGRSVRG